MMLSCWRIRRSVRFCLTSIPAFAGTSFCVDGTQLQAWASILLNVQHEASQMKSFVPRETSATSDDGPKLPPPAGSDAEPVAQSEEATPAGEQAPDEAASDEKERHDRNAEVDPRLRAS